jgi:hypothetical protein
MTAPEVSSTSPIRPKLLEESTLRGAKSGFAEIELAAFTYASTYAELE